MVIFDTIAMYVGYLSMAYFVIEGTLEVFCRTLKALGLWKDVAQGIWRAYKEKSK